MALSIDWNTLTITVPQADLTFVSGTLYELDTEAFREELNGIMDDTVGMPFLDPMRHIINRNQVSVIPTNSAGLIRNVDAVDDFVEALRTSIYDGVTFENLMRDVLAMANARIVESPDGVFTFYDRDNTTVRYTLTKAGNERTRS
jgi:hypothetical protein